MIEPTMELRTPGRPRVRLDGSWGFAYDPADAGVKHGWFAPDHEFAETCEVPGCDQATDHPSAGMNAEAYEALHREQGEFMMDVRYPTLAPAWHQRRFTVPSAWGRGATWLRVGGVHPAADFWLNGEHLGYTVSSRCPLRVNLQGKVRPGAVNTLTVRTCWPETPRLDGLFSCLSAFSGLYRSVWLERTSTVAIRSLDVVATTELPSTTFELTLDGAESASSPLIMEMTVWRPGDRGFTWFKEDLAPGETEHRTDLPMGDARLWSPDQPVLYFAKVGLRAGNRVLDEATLRFGVRSVKREGTRILLNGSPVFLRGACDDQCYPATICPPANVDFYRQRLRLARRYGFNYSKSCMDIFTEEYLNAADELGLMVCQELPFGLSGKYRTTIREQLPADYVALYRQELENIVRAYRHHPCIILNSMISEFAVDPMSETAFQLLCRDLPATARALHPSALVVDITSTGGGWAGNTPRGPRDTDVIEECAGDQVYQEPLSHPIAGRYADLDRPFILHEYNWWAGLPEPANADRYAHLPMKLNGVPELLAAANQGRVGEQVPRFVANARQLKYLLQKSGLELARRQPAISGYHFWLVSGFSWCQEGVFDEFYQELPGLSARTFRGYNDDTVLLLDDGNHRGFRGGRAPLGLAVSHFGATPLASPRIDWRLRRGTRVEATGQVPLAPVACGMVTDSADLGLELPPVLRASVLTLEATLRDGKRVVTRNSWPLWAVPEHRPGSWCRRLATDADWLRAGYPEMQPLDHDRLDATPVIVTGRWQPAWLDYLAAGGRLVFFNDGTLRDYRPGREWRPGEALGTDWVSSFTHLYRSAPWQVGQHGNTGTVIPSHPLFRGIPHGGWCNINWVHLIRGAYPLLLDWLPPMPHPLIRSIGHQRTMVNKAYLYELRVGAGVLLATSLRFTDTYVTHPETQFILDRLLRYVAGPRVEPACQVTPGDFRQNLVSPT